MAVTRFQVVLAPTSGLPEDQVVNTFHCSSAAEPTATELEDAAEIIRDFYVLPDGADVALDTNIAASIADNGHQVRAYTYDPADGTRYAGLDAPPEHVEAFDFLGRTGETVGLPNETALKVTFRNTSSVSVPLARRTGGIYFGPMEGANLIAGANQIAVPPAALINRLVTAADRVKDLLATAGMPLCVWSRPYEGRGEIIREGKDPLPAIPARDGSLHLVEQVFVDDEFDTIRKRGRRRGVRTIA